MAKKNPFRPSFVYTVFVSVPILIFYLFAALLIAFFDLVITRKFNRGPFITKLKESFAQSFFWAHGIRLEFLGKNPKDLNDGKPRIFVANHQSIVDIPALILILPPRTSFVAKEELKKIPIFGWGAYFIGTLFIDRSRAANQSALLTVRRYLKSGWSVIFFPEGTRSITGELGPFKRGAFVMAIDAEAEIVPVTILNSRFLCPKHRLSVGPGTLRIVIGEPISTLGSKSEDWQKISTQVRDEMAKQLATFSETRKNNIDCEE